MTFTFRFELLPKQLYDDFTYNYGAQKILSSYCETPASYRIAGFWEHGPILSEMKYYDGRFKLLGIDSELERVRKKWLFFTSRQDTAQYLKSNGFSSVLDVGLPFIYLEDTTILEIPNSILFFPLHSGRNDANKKFEPYQELLIQLREKFKVVGICLHGNDYSLEAENTCKEIGFDIVIEGANELDSNSLWRVKNSILQFEYVIADTFSSAIVYGAYLNKKVAIVDIPGTNHFIWDNELEGLKISIFNVINAKPHKEWGDRLVGINSKKTPEEIRRLFVFNPLNTLYYYSWFFRKNISSNTNLGLLRGIMCRFIDGVLFLNIKVIELISKIFFYRRWWR